MVNGIVKNSAIGICWPGGGAKGAHQAGSGKAMYEWFVAHRAHPAAMSFASVGVLNGLMFAQAFAPGDCGRSIEALERIWRDIRPGHVRSRFPNAAPWAFGVYNTKPLRRLLELELDLGKLRTTPVRFRVIASKWGKAENPTAGPEDEDFLDVVQACASFPIVFRPVRARGGWLFDRGVSNNRPTAELWDYEKVERVWIAHTAPAPSGHFKPYDKKPPRWWLQLFRLIPELMEAQLRLQEGNALNLFAAPAPELETLEFDKRKAAEAFAASYKKTRGMLERIDA